MDIVDPGTADIFFGRSTKAARKVCPQAIWDVARRKLDAVNAAKAIDDLKVPPGNKLHKLTDDRNGQDAISINSQYRVCFIWTDAGASSVEITDYH